MKIIKSIGFGILATAAGALIFWGVGLLVTHLPPWLFGSIFICLIIFLFSRLYIIIKQ